jgi:Polyketide cyclase / dehydrase and lipid transport
VPAAVVWHYRLDFTNLPEYNPDVDGVVRVADGDPSGPWGVLGPGARYTFSLADARRPGASQPVELWPVTVEEPTLVAAAMTGASDAYEEFAVRPIGEDGCEATLTLWVTLPPEFADNEAARAASAAGGLAQISKELRLMKAVLEDPTRRATTTSTTSTTR